MAKRPTPGGGASADDLKDLGAGKAGTRSARKPVDPKVKIEVSGSQDADVSVRRGKPRPTAPIDNDDEDDQIDPPRGNGKPAVHEDTEEEKDDTMDMIQLEQRVTELEQQVRMANHRTTAAEARVTTAENAVTALKAEKDAALLKVTEADRLKGLAEAAATTLKAEKDTAVAAKTTAESANVTLQNSLTAETRLKDAVILAKDAADRAKKVAEDERVAAVKAADAATKNKFGCLGLGLSALTAFVVTAVGVSIGTFIFCLILDYVGVWPFSAPVVDTSAVSVEVERLKKTAADAEKVRDAKTLELSQSRQRESETARSLQEARTDLERAKNAVPHSAAPKDGFIFLDDAQRRRLEELAK